jgi:hypothetical protein
LASGVGNNGDYYISSTDNGTFVLDGNTYDQGDWLIFNAQASAWQKIDNSDKVQSVAGKIGAVLLNTDDITEASNLYYTESRVNANPSVVANTSHRNNATIHREINDTIPGTTVLWSGSKIQNELNNKVNIGSSLTSGVITGNPNLNLKTDNLDVRNIFLDSFGCNTEFLRVFGGTGEIFINGSTIEGVQFLKHNVTNLNPMVIGSPNNQIKINYNAIDDIEIKGDIKPQISNDLILKSNDGNKVLKINDTGIQLKELIVKNDLETFQSNILYSGLDKDKQLDLYQIDTLGATATSFPPAFSGAPPDPNAFTNTEGTFISSASNFNVGNDPWKAFDGLANFSNMWSTVNGTYNAVTGNYAGTNNTNGYLGEHLQLQLPFLSTAVSYTISVRTDLAGRLSPTTWRVFGSTDGISWSQIDEQISVNWGPTESNRQFTINTPTEANYYRIVVNKTSESYVGTGNRYACQILEVSFGASNTCPSSCLHVNNEVVVNGDIRSLTNANISGGLTVGNVLQDTNKDAYISCYYTGALVFPITGTVGTPFNAFNLFSGYNISGTTTGASLQEFGDYEVSMHINFESDSNGNLNVSLLSTSGTGYNTSVLTNGLKDTPQSVSTSFIDVAGGLGTNYSIQFLSLTSITLTIYNVCLVVKRLRKNV